MKIKIMQGDTGCCASDCEFKKFNWCNLFFETLYGFDDNPTRCGSCQQLTSTDAEFSSIRFKIDNLSKCFGCERYRIGFPNNCIAGNQCKDGSLNRCNL